MWCMTLMWPSQFFFLIRVCTTLTTVATGDPSFSMYVCDTEPWFQQQLSRISPLSAQHGSECDRCCVHVCVKVLSCFVSIIHVLPCLHLSYAFCYDLSLVSALSCHWFIFQLCHNCTHLFRILAWLWSWLDCIFKPLCVFVLSWSLVHFCALFHVLLHCILVHMFLCFSCDFLV